MKSGSRFIAVFGLVFSAMISEPATPAEPGSADPESEECTEDEIDMGEYCMKLVPVEPEPPGAPKATPFRKESMMPGVVRRPGAKPSKRQADETPAPKPAVVVTQAIPSPVIAEGGYGIQLGAWSKRDSAERVCNGIKTGVSGVMLSPMPRGEGVLWACIAGPFASKDAARADLALLRADHHFGEAFLKPLNGMRLEAVEEDSANPFPE